MDLFAESKLTCVSPGLINKSKSDVNGYPGRVSKVEGFLPKNKLRKK